MNNSHSEWVRIACLALAGLMILSTLGTLLYQLVYFF